MRKSAMVLLAAVSLLLAGCHEEWDGAADELESVAATTKTVTAVTEESKAAEESDAEGDVTVAERYEDSYTAAFCQRLAKRDFQLETEEYRVHTAEDEGSEELEWKKRSITQVYGDEVYLFNDGGQRDESGVPYVEHQYYFGDEAYSMLNGEVFILGENDFSGDEGIGRLEMRVFSQEPEKLGFISSEADGNTVKESFIIKTLEGEEVYTLTYDSESGDLMSASTNKSRMVVTSFRENTGAFEIPEEIEDFEP